MFSSLTTTESSYNRHDDMSDDLNFFLVEKINKLTEYAIPADYWVIGANYTHLSAQ